MTGSATTCSAIRTLVETEASPATFNLETINWGNYDLVVIDESHNFRNNVPGKSDEDGNIIRRSRYERLMQEIIQTGIRTKVLLLSATPVNNDLKDLRNQIYFMTAGSDDAFTESIGIQNIKETLRQAQGHFSNWAKQTPSKRKTSDLLARLGADFFKLLDELTIARARKHLQKYYRHEMDRLGRFPERLKPMTLSPEIDSAGRFMSYDKLSHEIDGYKLSLFNPSQFVLPRVQGRIREEDRELYPVPTRRFPDRHDEGQFSEAARKLCPLLCAYDAADDGQDRIPGEPSQDL